MDIPEEVLRAAAQGMWDTDAGGPDAPWNDLASSFRASLMTQVEAACQPIAEWARKEALKEAADLALTPYVGVTNTAFMSYEEAAEWGKSKEIAAELRALAEGVPGE